MATEVTETYQKAAQLDFKLRETVAPKYKLVKIPMNNQASSSVTITPTGSIVLEWKLPTKAYNLARSYISYSTASSVVGATGNVTFEDTFDIAQSITFGSAGGVDLVNLQNLQNYVKIARKIATSVDDYLGNDEMSQLYRAGTGNGTSTLPFFYPGGAVIANPNVAVGGFVGTDINTSLEPYFDTTYTALATGAGNTMLRYRQFPLGGIPGTLLSVDRDFYSPVEQYLRITVGPGNKIAYSTSTTAIAGDYSAGQVAIDNITINNCYLYLAVEQNVDVIEQLMTLYNEGKMTYSIPYTTAFKNVGGSALAQTNIQIQLSQQYGKRLKRILHTVWNPTERLSTSYDCHNYNGSKIQSYQTFLDTMPIQDRILVCYAPGSNGLTGRGLAPGVVNEDDWLENKKFLEKRSCITSKNMYKLNWFHIDQFYEPHDKEGSLPEVNLDEGLLMDTSKQWVFSGTAGATAAQIHYTYVEFSRELLVTNAGPIFV